MKISELKGKIETVSPGQRVGHFIIDLFVIEIISYFISLIPSAEFTGLVNLLLFPTYYILFEYYKQWTPGKFITNTIVINDYGEKPDIQTIILRTFIRFVPFEPFSCMDNKSWGWHDRWTKTYVVKKENLVSIKDRLGVSTMDEANTSARYKKSLFIISVFLVIGIAGYFTFREIKEVINMSPGNIIKEFNETDYRMIKGEWDTDWDIYKSLHFKENDTLVATNQNGDTLNLSYSIDTKTLTINDESGLELQYFIIELSDGKMILRDIETMKDNIVFSKR